VYPAVDIRPLDLFSADRNKRIWDLKVNHLNRQYDVVGVFNFDDTKTAPTYVSWNDLGLPDTPVHVYDFWNKEYLGAWEKGITVEVNPASTRLLTLVPATDQVQLISTSRHITQGWVDLLSQNYNAATKTFKGSSKVIKADPYELRFAFPRGEHLAIKRAVGLSKTGRVAARITNHQGWSTVEFLPAQTGILSWEITFEAAPAYKFPVREPQSLWIERAGIDGVNLRWNVQHQPAVGYQVWLNGKLIGFSPTQVFAFRGLDPNTTYNAEVRTVWQDGTASEKQGKLQFTVNQVLPDQIFISELEPIRLTPGWRQPELNRNSNGGGLLVGNRRGEKGIGMPTNSDIEFELNGSYETFTALVGIDDEFNNREAAAEFIVLGDDKELWRSGGLKKTDAAKSLKVDVKNVKRLILRVRRVDEGGRILADWLDAKLSR
jgi:hypothetical protein